MKFRAGWVSNSSATAFMMTNLTMMVKTLVDFVKETPWIIEKFREQYDHAEEEGYTQETLLASAEENNISFAPGEEKVVIFGDEQRTIIGQVYDYMLRGRDVSKAGLLYEQIKACDKQGELNRSRELFDKWIEATQEHEDKFEGIDSPSFKVRFHEWLR